MIDKAEQTNSDNKIFYPICKEKGCDGLLKIKINVTNHTSQHSQATLPDRTRISTARFLPEVTKSGAKLAHFSFTTKFSLL